VTRARRGGLVSETWVRRGHSLTPARKVPLVSGMALASNLAGAFSYFVIAGRVEALPLR
jgi:hypothetical protein